MCNTKELYLISRTTLIYINAQSSTDNNLECVLGVLQKETTNLALVSVLTPEAPCVLVIPFNEVLKRIL